MSVKLNLSENAQKVLERRYLKRDSDGNIVETPEEMFRRVAQAVAAADKMYGANSQDIKKTEKEFYSVMTDLEFMPNSPTLINAGRKLGQLSACFVIELNDSMESIFEGVKVCAMIHKSGGGTGMSFSRLRPKDSIVETTGGMASGPVSFMKVFDSATQAVRQGGVRRGANMGILRVDHPDILEFITCKESDKDITNFNISVAVSKDFMEKLEKGQDYDLIDPHTKKAAGRLNTKEVFDLIVKQAHKNGEPGVIFIDRMNEFNPTPKLGRYESTNPCGEQVLLPFESCNLGSINLLKFAIRDGNGFSVDWERLRRTVHIAAHFLDNVIDVNKFPLEMIERNTKLTRKIGLGVMGWGNMLARLGIPYDSDEALALAEKIMSFILDDATKESCELAERRGVFPAFKDSVYGKPNGLKVRNATLTTIAPTGTISIIAGPCSSGIEPIFAVSYYRNVMDNTKLIEIDPVFEEVAKERGFYSQQLMDKIAAKGSIRDIDEVPADVKRVFVTSHDISPEWHVKMQAAFQKYTHNACSKTINFPNEASQGDVRKAYLLAYNLGCKGITIYRDRSREEQVLNIPREPKVTKDSVSTYEKLSPKPRPEVISGTTIKISTGCGNLYVTVNVDKQGHPFEIFTQMGKAGGCAASQLEAVARLVSLAFRCGIDMKDIIEQLKGIRCPSPAWENGGRIFSCADAIARAMEKRQMPNIEEKIGHQVTKSPSHRSIAPSPQPIAPAEFTIVGVCPDCGDSLRHEEGCMVCVSCGYSKC